MCKFHTVLAIGVATTLGDNHIISYHDLPRYGLDRESSEYLEALFPIYKGGCAVTASRSGKAVTVYV